MKLSFFLKLGFLLAAISQFGFANLDARAYIDLNSAQTSEQIESICNQNDDHDKCDLPCSTDQDRKRKSQRKRDHKRHHKPRHCKSERHCKLDKRQCQSCDFANASFRVLNASEWYSISTPIFPSTTLLSQNRNQGFDEGCISLTNDGISIDKKGHFSANFTAILQNPDSESDLLLTVCLL